MSGLTDTDLAWVRDEIGTTTPPSDDQLHGWYDELTHRTLVAIRVLKRRFADKAGGASPDSFALSGVMSVSMKADLRALRDQIARLEAQYETETGTDLPGAGATSTFLTRRTAR